VFKKSTKVTMKVTGNLYLTRYDNLGKIIHHRKYYFNKVGHTTNEEIMVVRTKNEVKDFLRKVDFLVIPFGNATLVPHQAGIQIFN